MTLDTYEEAYGHEMTPKVEHEADDPEMSSLITRFQVIFCDVSLYRRMLRLQGSHAQSLLDAIQWMLDAPKLDFALRHRLIVAAQRISMKFGLYPTCYKLENVVQECQHPLTAGGFADIYRGDFEGSKVCLKVIRIYEATKIEHYLKQFSKEMILWGQLCHPNVLPIYGLCWLRTQICLVSPWMQQGDVNSYLKIRPEAARLQLVVDVAQGLLYLHKNKIIHGDLKGPNVLVNEFGRACIADFGISSVSDPNILAWTSHSSVASKGGSVRWQAPELIDIENDEVVMNTEASDVYAWSCVCYEIFTGNVPFANLQLDATVMLKVKSGAQPARPQGSSHSWRDWGLTEDIWLLMQHCWSADPTERPKIEDVIKRLAPLITVDERSQATGSLMPPAYFRKRMAKPSDVAIASLRSTLDDLLHLKEDSPLTPGDMLDTDEHYLAHLNSCPQRRAKATMGKEVERGSRLEWHQTSEPGSIAGADRNHDVQSHTWKPVNHGTPPVSSRNPFRQSQTSVRTMSGNFLSVGGSQNIYTGSVVNSNFGNMTTNIISNSSNSSPVWSEG